MAEPVRIKRFTAQLGSHPCLAQGTQYIERQTDGGFIERWKMVRMQIEQPYLLTYERIDVRPVFYDG